MALFVYITCASPDEADRIGHALLDERLAACVNILPSLNRAVRRLHSYETPCVVALPLVAGDPDYLAWVEDSTRPATLV